MNGLSNALFQAVFLLVLSSEACLAMAKPCSSGLLKVRVSLPDDHVVLINGIFAAEYHDSTLDTIRKRLGLTDEVAKSFAQKVILSVGEGKSPLLPFLLGLSFQTRAVDLWYSAPRSLRKTTGGRELLAYIEQFGDFMIAADSTNIPLESGSVDLIVSHHLVNNFSYGPPDYEVDIEKTVDTFVEALRLLKPGGQVRIFGVDPLDVGEILELLQENSPYQFKLIQAQTHLVEDWDQEPFEHVLIVLERLDP